MHWLEERFRRKFEPHGDGFLYRQVNREVIFDCDDVETLVADWRRYWFSPWLWGGLLLFGIALPAIVTIWGLPGWEVTLLIAAFTWLAFLVSLGVAISGPDDAARKLESVGPGHGRTMIWGHLLIILMALLQLWQVRPDRLVGNWGYLIWGGLLLVSLVQVVQALRKRRRASLSTAEATA